MATSRFIIVETQGYNIIRDTYRPQEHSYMANLVTRYPPYPEAPIEEWKFYTQAELDTRARELLALLNTGASR